MFGRGKWIDIEIFELRAGGVIRIINDKVQRRKDDDGSQYYYLRGEKETLEPQEFEDIFVGSKGQQKLKCFSVTKGVYWPIKFVLKQVRDLNVEEKKKIDEEKDLKKKKRLEKEIYKKIYDAYLETVVDTETLNHTIYKIQKNHLRLQTKTGLSPTIILTVVIIILAIFIILSSWAEYTYFLKPAMEFWNNQAPKIMEASQRVSCSNPTSATPSPVPVG